MRNKIILCFLIFIQLGLILRSEVVEEEYRLKSIFILRICKFTQWPSTFEYPNKPFIISVLGNLPAGEEIFFPKGVTLFHKNILVRKIKEVEEINGSDVLFIASSENNRLETILRYIEGRPILTVGDTRGFGARGVCINLFVTPKQSIGYEINPEAYKRSFLKPNSYLFTYGTVVSGPLEKRSRQDQQ
ncbi:MAG: YfiR family protein [Candidatus Omnitrophota bacterium]